MVRQLMRYRVLLALAVAVSAAGVSVVVEAQTQPTTIYGCVVPSSGTVKIVAAGTECPPNQVPIQWNVTGPTGPTGDKGDKGDPGSPIMWSGGCSQDGPSEDTQALLSGRNSAQM